jgi:hypothetical protein
MAEKPENEANPVISSSQPSHKPGGQQGPAEAPKPEKETKERESFWRRATREPVVFFALCLVVAIFLLLFVYAVQFRSLTRAEYIAEKAAEAARKSAEVAERSAEAARKSAEVAEKTLLAAQRPWLSVHTRIGSDLVFSRKEGGGLTIIYTVKNVGNSPAIDVEVNAKIFLERLFISGKEREEQIKLCSDEWRKSLPPNRPDAGLVLLPNEEFVYSISTVISWEDINQSRHEMEKLYGAGFGAGSIGPELVGCVSYRFAVDSSVHTTGFAYYLETLDPRFPNSTIGIKTNAGTTPASMLKLDPSRFGAHAN